MNAALVLAVVLGACGADARAGTETYLDIMESAVRAYSDAHVAEYADAAEKDGVQEHGFPRLAANLGFLVAHGRLAERKDVAKRLLDISCRDAKRGVMPPKSGGNEFSVKELVAAVAALERAGVFPKETTDAWRADISAIDAERCYTTGRIATGLPKAKNWVVFACASEQARIAHGMGGDPAFVEKYVADQLRWFDENGMYKDPNQPIVYDIVTRLQFMHILSWGYDGPSRGRLLGELAKSAEPTLAMLSACGEIPYGGRSNQFLHNHTFYAAVCEWYAAERMRAGDAASAARFGAAARRATDALAEWLAVRPVRHVKNFYPRGGSAEVFSDRGDMGCERYAYFNKYMVTMGSWAMSAAIFAADGVRRPADVDPAPQGRFELSKAFHQTLLRAGDYSAQVTYNADTHYDADGIGRLHRRGAPPTICLSTPCTTTPSYRIAGKNSAPLAIAPFTDYRLDADGLTVEGRGAIALPAFEFDGETNTVVRCDGRSLEISYKGWVCKYTALEGRIFDTGGSAENRNGRYRRYELRGEGALRVKVSIEKEKAR